MGDNRGVVLGGLLVLLGLFCIVSAVNGQLASFLAGFAGAAGGNSER